MRRSTSALLIGAAITLSACSGGGLFDRGSMNGGRDDVAGAATGAATTAQLNPSSPQYFTQTIGDRVLFEVDQSTLTPAARSTLVGQAQWLLANPGYAAIIEGHADEQGTRTYNLALGSRRAAAARDFLVSQGIADSRLEVVSFGKERPIEICSEEACYAKNRRAVTVISAALGS